MTAIDYEQIANEIINLDDMIDRLTEERDNLKTALLVALPPGTKQPAGDLTITISQPTRRLNTRAITAQYPVHEHPELYKAVIDTALVHENIAPATLEAGGLYTESAPRVTIR